MIDQIPTSDHQIPKGCPFAEQMASDALGYAPLASLQLIGLSFRTADLALRGRVSFSGDRLQLLLSRLMEARIAESLALCTCNRTEILFYGDEVSSVRAILTDLTGVDAGELDEHLYVKSGHLAAEHLFRVCSGMESAVIGETDILAQVKEALAISQTQKSIGPWLNLLLRHAFATSKRVRTETDLCRGVTSLGSLAVREARTIIGDLSGKSILIVGAGRIAERLVKDIVLEKPARVIVSNRTLAAAQVLAERHGLEICSLEAAQDRLVETDIVLTAVGTPEPIFDASLFETVTSRRDGRPLVVVDLGVPANVSPAAKSLPGVVAVDVDHLIERCAKNTQKREASIPFAEAIIRESIGDLAHAFSDREAAGAIKALVQRCEEVREQNLAWAFERLGAVDPQQKKVIEDLTLRMMRGLLESPIRSLKDSSFGADEREVVLRLFEAGGDENS
jgi:glutamyl-tRNA reductase